MKLPKTRNKQIALVLIGCFLVMVPVMYMWIVILERMSQ